MVVDKVIVENGSRFLKTIILGGGPMLAAIIFVQLAAIATGIFARLAAVRRDTAILEFLSRQFLFADETIFTSRRRGDIQAARWGAPGPQFAVRTWRRRVWLMVICSGRGVDGASTRLVTLPSLHRAALGQV